MTKRTIEIAVNGYDALNRRVAAYRMRVPLKEGFGLRVCQRLNAENPGIVHLYRIGWSVGDSLPRNQCFTGRETS